MFNLLCVTNGVSYDEVMELLDEENLKKQSMEKLILLSSFWSNRVNKVVSQINESLYIISEQELLRKQDVNEEGNAIYAVSEQDKKAVNLKFKLLHKLCFEMFDEIDKDRKEDETQRNPEKYVKKLVRKYGKQYEEYFNKILPNVNNSLENDLWFAMLYENIRYNSYKVKDKSIEALLVCLSNNSSNEIENYGCRLEPDKKRRKHMSISVDMKGLNMPLMLHVDKQLVLDFLQESQDTTLFPIYQGGEDFCISSTEEINAQILFPFSKEVEQRLQKSAKPQCLGSKRRKTLNHILYLTQDGKMPEHMMEQRKSKKGVKYKYVRKYMDLAESDDKRSENMVL